MKCRLCLLTIIFVSLLTSCSSFGKSKDKSANMEEVIFDDEYKTTAENKIVIEDKDFEGKEKAVSVAGENSQEITKIASDNSKITTMFDRYGNTTETRYFNYHTRLSFILLRTSATGEKQVFVYGQNGEVKSLPENMLDKVLTASANELANSAGIFEGSRESFAPVIVQSNQPPLQPMPSYKFPIQQPQIEAVPAETNEPETDEPATAETTKPEGKTSSAPKSKSENLASKTPSDEKK